MRSRTGQLLLEQGKTAGSEQCIYVAVKIHIHAAPHSAQALY